jgi:hypothetical protein
LSLKGVAKPVGYVAYELPFGGLLVVVAAIPLGRDERWACWCCLVPVLAFAAFGTLSAVHNSADLAAAIVAGLFVALALIALLPTGSAGKQLRPSHRAPANGSREPPEPPPFSRAHAP